MCGCFGILSFLMVGLRGRSLGNPASIVALDVYPSPFGQTNAFINPHPSHVGGSMNTELDEVISHYYGGDQVTAVVTLKVDTKEADRIASEVARFDAVQDCFLVTGDTDIIVKARFADYRGLKEFVVRSLAPIAGIKDTKTLMVVTTYKESGAKR